MPQFHYDNNLDSIHSCRKKLTCKGLLITSCNESRKPNAHSNLVKHKGHITAIQTHTEECARIRLELEQQWSRNRAQYSRFFCLTSYSRYLDDVIFNHERSLSSRSKAQHSCFNKCRSDFSPPEVR